MDDLISRQAAIDAVNKALDRETIIYGFVRKVAIDSIKTLPTAQPERKHGRWLKTRDGEHGVCSRCAMNRVDLMDGREHNFCELCGAKMDAEECEDGQTDQP